MTNPGTDLAAGWIFIVLVLTVLAILDAVLQMFALHSALATAKVHAPEIAGLKLFVLWFPTVILWLAAGIGLALLRTPERCSSADAAPLFLGALYLLTAWPPLWLGRSRGVRLPRWYWDAQLTIATLLVALGAVPCL